MSTEQVQPWRDALRATHSALGYTVTNVKPIPHWCRFTNGDHDPTCAAYLRIQERNRALLQEGKT